MKYQVITLFVIVSLCHGQTQKPVNDSIIINNATDPIPSVTDVPSSSNGTNTSTTSTTPSTTVTTTTVPSTTKPTTSIPTTKPSTSAPTTLPPPPSTTNATTSTTVKPTQPAPSPSTTKEPSPKPPTTTAVPPTPSSNRKFDGPSFVGGIVLASGLMAISFVAFKFYKARTELNYHTL